MGIKRLNHAVLYVRDADRSAEFYSQLLGFVPVEQMRGAVFMKAGGSENHHDLGLFSIGPDAPDPTAGDRVGLYHLAWEVDRIEDLVPLRQELMKQNALTGASDHGTSLSLYGQDPDGNQFEVFWPVPQQEWSQRGFGTRALRLEDELAKRRSA